jgi:hypothetical protein
MSFTRVLIAAVALFGTSSAYAAGLDLKLRNAEGQEVLNKILDDDAFWADAWTKDYNDKQYDQIRLKQLPTGYVPMISGEGGQDFDHMVVADVVYYKNTLLPKYMEGAKIVIDMGKGFDDTVGAEYRDTFYVLDLTAFYGTFPQRMYRKHDEATNTSVMWFEKIEPNMVPAATWAEYQKKMTTAVDNMDKGWLFSSVVPVGEIYGMFVVEPGKARETRVSFVSKLTFGDDAGWVARFGSQLPGVLKAGLRGGFGASVAIAAFEQEKRDKKAAETPAPAPVPVPVPAPAEPPQGLGGAAGPASEPANSGS